MCILLFPFQIVWSIAQYPKGPLMFLFTQLVVHFSWVYLVCFANQINCCDILFFFNFFFFYDLSFFSYLMYMIRKSQFVAHAESRHFFSFFSFRTNFKYHLYAFLSYYRFWWCSKKWSLARITKVGADQNFFSNGLVSH